MDSIMWYINDFFFIFLLAFIIFVVYAFLRVQRINKAAFERTQTMMDRQVEALNKMDKTNQLLSEILAALKK